jgi:hypothetical protein
MREEYLGEEAHDLPLLLDPEGECRLVGPQEVLGMARDQLIDDGDTTVLATWMTSEKNLAHIDLDPLVRGTDPDLDHSIIKQK